jgi:hypothetical protein
VITARLETQKYCFRNSVHGIRLKGFEAWRELVITAIYWSSLARYYYFITAGSWGLWHDEIHMENVEDMPICFPSDGALRDRIVDVVGKLQKLDLRLGGLELGGAAARQQVLELERELDDAIFDLYQLNAAERDLVHEMCTIGLDLFYQNQKSDALREAKRPAGNAGTLADISTARTGLADYLRVFLESWRKELGADGDLFWQVLSPPSRAPLLAVSFTTYDTRPSVLKGIDGNGEAWRSVLTKLIQSSRVRAHSSRVFVDTFFRHVGDQDVLFIKRNEQRFWTRTAAREDAESTLTHLLNQGDIALGAGR